MRGNINRTIENVEGFTNNDVSPPEELWLVITKSVVEVVTSVVVAEVLVGVGNGAD